MKKILFLDMDGVLADFEAGVGRWPFEQDPPEMFVKEFFRKLPVKPGALQAVDAILKLDHIDTYIGSKPTTKNLDCATEKMQWIEEHFPALLRKMNLVCDKGLLNGHYLVDDDLQWKGRFPGLFLHFDKFEPELSWHRIVTFLTNCP